MNSKESPAESSWDEALREAVSGGSAQAISGPSLFLEEREDAVVELDDRLGRTEERRSRIRGMSASGGAPEAGLAFRGDPVPDDAARLVLAASGSEPSGAWSARNDSESSPEVALPVAGAIKLLEQLVEKSRCLQPTATVRARWVGFRQSVRIARAGRSVVRDLRQGSRIRLEARSGGEEPASAVVESVISPELARVEPLLDRLPREVAARLDERRRTRTLSSGEHVVVFAPGVGGILVHELVGHALEADAVLGRMSWLSDVEGAVGPNELTVVDDPRRGRAGWKTDDEGESARPVALLREGRVAAWMHDLSSSRESGQAATGHGRRASYRDPVRPRMGCTWVAAGRHHPSAAFEGIHDGIYVRRMEAASTDPRSGRSVFRVTDADRIHRGRLDAALAPHVISLDAARALNGIERIGSDLEFDRCIGSCLRGGQPLATSVGAPTFRLGLITAMF